MRLYEILDDPQVDKLYIIMEYISGGSLFDKLSKSKSDLHQQDLWQYFRQTLNGLHYCKSIKLSSLSIVHESAQVVHRDLKPENLLIDEENRVKISDFGVSYLIENGSDDITSTAGSNYFFSPEIC